MLIAEKQATIYPQVSNPTTIPKQEQSVPVPGHKTTNQSRAAHRKSKPLESTSTLPGESCGEEAALKVAPSCVDEPLFGVVVEDGPTVPGP